MADKPRTPTIPTFVPTTVTIPPTVVPISEREIRAKIIELQKKMGIPTEDEINPLGPGATDQELWPAQPGELWTDFRIV